MARKYANTDITLEACGDQFGVYLVRKPYMLDYLPVVFRKDRGAAYRAAARRLRAMANECERRERRLKK